MSLFATTAYAAPATIDTLILKVNQYVLNPFIALLFVIATVVFLWGLVSFYIVADDEKSRTRGHQLIKWGIVGMFIMVSVFGIMRVIVNTLGVNVNEFGASIPNNQ